MIIIKELKTAIELLSKNEFVQAHDIFEDLWRAYKDSVNTREESFILKAFTNASISIELHKMNRSQHSTNVWNTFKKYENLIDTIITPNRDKYKEIKTLIYTKRDEFIK